MNNRFNNLKKNLRINKFLKLSPFFVSPKISHFNSKYFRFYYFLFYFSISRSTCRVESSLCFFWSSIFSRSRTCVCCARECVWGWEIRVFRRNGFILFQNAAREMGRSFSVTPENNAQLIITLKSFELVIIWHPLLKFCLTPNSN